MQSHRFPLVQSHLPRDSLWRIALGKWAHRQPQPLPPLPHTDPDRAPLAQAQSIQRWRQRDVSIPAKPRPRSRAKEPRPWLLVPHSLQIPWRAGSSSCPCSARSRYSKDLRDSCPVARHQWHPATLPPGLLCQWRKGHGCCGCSHRGCRTELKTFQAEGTAVTRALEQTTASALGSGCPNDPSSLS